MFPFSSSPSESPCPSQSGESFSEAFLNSSSARDSLPDQYRAHFDELRSGILAFCHEFEIPVETLRSKENFGKQLASKRIPPKRMAEAVSLFARLEHLVTNKEPLGEEKEAIEYADRLYNLTEQYTAQVELLERVGILKEGTITGIDGKKYPIPTLEQIASHLLKREKELFIKREQGFTKLLLVPFGMSLGALRETFRQFLFSYKQAKIDSHLDISVDYLLSDGGDSPKLVYNPQSFSKDHQGQTKLHILEEQTGKGDSATLGWKVHLLQPSDPTDLHSPGFASIPREEQGYTHGKETPRPSLEAGKSPNDYLSILQEAQDNPKSPYHGESGLTPEDWILAFMTHLEETGEPLDDAGNHVSSVSHLIGAFFPSSIDVPHACWDRDNRKVFMSGDLPDSRNELFGIRTSVIV